MDAFTIMRIAGHSTLSVAQRYVHPTPETLERAIERLETENIKATRAEKRQAVATVSATLKTRQSVAVQ